MEAEFIQLPSCVSFSVFIIVTDSLPTTHVCLQPHLFFFFFWSSSENFQLWFKLPAMLVIFTCIQSLHPSWLLCRKDLASELWFLLLWFILICTSFVLASHQLSSHPARNPQVIQTSSIWSQTLFLNHPIYSLNQGNLFYYLDPSVIHLEHKYGHIIPLVKVFKGIYEFKSSQLAPAILFHFWSPELVNNYVYLRPALFIESF